MSNLEFLKTSWRFRHSKSHLPESEILEEFQNLLLKHYRKIKLLNFPGATMQLRCMEFYYLQILHYNNIPIQKTHKAQIIESSFQDMFQDLSTRNFREVPMNKCYPLLKFLHYALINTNLPSIAVFDIKLHENKTQEVSKIYYIGNSQNLQNNIAIIHERLFDHNEIWIERMKPKKYIQKIIQL